MEKAVWIGAPDGATDTCPRLVKNIRLRGKVQLAELRVTAMGLYRFYINGKDITDNLFMPGWTSYLHRTQVQTYDVSGFLTDNTQLSALLGKGWAASDTFAWQKHAYAARPALIAQLKVLYTDGSEELFCTDESWEVWSSFILFSEFYDGETQDITRPVSYLCQAKKQEIETELILQEGEDIVEAENVFPSRIFKTPKGETVLDFGQNMAGYVRIRGKAVRGEKLSFVPGEILDTNGNFYNANYRRAVGCRYSFTFSGNEDDFRPVFSFLGFRYLRLDEFPESLKSGELTLTAVAVHSQLRRTCRYVCGNEKINRLYENIVWGQLSNYLDIPTDCPQRDERLGWTGDAEVFCRTAAINFDVRKFFRKWLHDMLLDQNPDGSIDGVIPATRLHIADISAGWGDAITICPWEMYIAYGEEQFLSDCYPGMCKWLDYIQHTGDNPWLWNTGKQYGDWLATDSPYGSYGGATDTGLIATAFFAYSALLTARTAETLGKTEEAANYQALYNKIKNAFRKEYMENGLPKGMPVVCDGKENSECFTQTAIALILRFGLAEDNEKKGLTEALVALIERNGMRMNTGFLGTPHILHALSENGRTDIAYRLLLQEKAPSWLYSVNHGATTMWEHWDGINEEGKLWSESMNSFNHYAYGAVFDWIFGVSAGIKPLEPGYRRICISPHPCRELVFSDVTYETSRGTLRARWHCSPAGGITYSYEIQEGITAELNFPGGKKHIVTGGTYLFTEI